VIRLARWLSIIVHPLVTLLATLALVVFHATHQLSTAVTWTLYAAVFASILALFVALGVRRQLFTNTDVSVRSERTYLYLFSAILASVYALGLFALRAPSVVFLLAAGLGLLLALLALVNRRIKASGHVACVTIFCLVVYVLYGALFVPVLLLIPSLAWSRVILGRHTVKEVCVGALVGLVIVLTGVTYLA
jgi:hypothetical protein